MGNLRFGCGKGRLASVLPLGWLVVLLAATGETAGPQSATLQVITSPPGAAITIDGKLAGLSPRSETLTPGVHTLSAELSGAVTSQTISLIEGEVRKVTLSVVAPLGPRPAPIAGLVTIGGGALAFGLGILLQLPARDAAREVNRLFQLGGGWDGEAQRIEEEGLSAQTWSWFFSGAGVVVMASGLIVTGLQLFGQRELPALAFLPIAGGGVLSWGTRW